MGAVLYHKKEMESLYLHLRLLELLFSSFSFLLLTFILLTTAGVWTLTVASGADYKTDKLCEFRYFFCTVLSLTSLSKLKPMVTDFISTCAYFQLAYFSKIFVLFASELYIPSCQKYPTSKSHWFVCAKCIDLLLQFEHF